jgi:hypothetical protein
LGDSGGQSSGDLANARIWVCDRLVGDSLVANLCSVWCLVFLALGWMLVFFYNLCYFGLLWFGEIYGLAMA